MSAPRIKRPFAGAAAIGHPAQRQITDFFGKNSSPSIEYEPSLSISNTNSPLLPANVQANLLSVGMRVRKSIPEGYKTGSLYGGLQLWSDAGPPPVARESGTTGGGDGACTSPGFASTGTSTTSRRELLPFCGINKVGGFATQPSFDEFEAPSIFSDSQFGVAALEDVPGLTSSQDSVESAGLPESAPVSAMASMRSAATNRKRIYAADDIADIPSRYGSYWVDEEVSPRSLAPVGWGAPRVLAVPRLRGLKRTASTSGPADLSNLDQENMAMEDFEEAPFLVAPARSDIMDLADG